jgi:methylenetetrahydrofolate dehydrogenase (NADP+)/methenyltetrahydrofolate cyclohydrolase
MKVLDGKVLSRSIIDILKEEQAPEAYLALFVVGDDEATKSFIVQKKKVADQLGVEIHEHTLSTDITTQELAEHIIAVGNEEECGGIVVQLPLPAHIDVSVVLSVIPPHKDVDVLNSESQYASLCGSLPVLSPAIATVNSFLSLAGVDQHTLGTMVVVGARGRLVGAPVVSYFDSRARVVELEKGDDVCGALADADVVVSGTGIKGLFSTKDIKNGAVVIDFGYGKDEQGIGGDFSSQDIDDKEGWYTPTPGGTGPVLVAHLYANFYLLNRI